MITAERDSYVEAALQALRTGDPLVLYGWGQLDGGR